MSRRETACHECDLLLTVPPINEGQRADCPRCGGLITARPRQGIERGMSFAIAACVFLVVSLSFPFLSFSSSGLEVVMTLPQAALTIYEEKDLVLAGIILVLIIGLPASLLVAILMLTMPLVLGWRVSWLKGTGRFVFTVTEWNMVEVFIIGVIVSLVKIAKLATVVLGLSFWAYIVFTLCVIAALSGLDRYEVWSRIEAHES